jgi:ParB/RepB/Spo0J family partition protein
MRVAVKDIEVVYNPRSKFEDIKALAESIKRTGLLQPLTIAKNGNGYRLLDGERRLRAVKLLKWDSVDVFVKDLDEQQQKAVAIETDLFKDLLPIGDKAVAIANLVNKEKKYSAESIGKALGIAVKRVKRFIKIARLHPLVIAQVNLGQISEFNAELLSEVDSEGIQLKISNLLSKGTATDLLNALEQVAYLVDFEDTFLYERIKKDRKLGIILKESDYEECVFCFDKAVFDKHQKEYEAKTQQEYAKHEKAELKRQQEVKAKQNEEKAKRKGDHKKKVAKRAEVYELLKSSVDKYIKDKPSKPEIDKEGKQYSFQISMACAKALLRAWGIKFTASDMSSDQIKSLCYKEVLSQYVKDTTSALRLKQMKDKIGQLEVNLNHLDIAKPIIKRLM